MPVEYLQATVTGFQKMRPGLALQTALIAVALADISLVVLCDPTNNTPLSQTHVSARTSAQTPLKSTQAAISSTQIPLTPTQAPVTLTYTLLTSTQTSFLSLLTPTQASLTPTLTPLAPTPPTPTQAPPTPKQAPPTPKQAPLTPKQAPQTLTKPALTSTQPPLASTEHTQQPPTAQYPEASTILPDTQIPSTFYRVSWSPNPHDPQIPTATPHHSQPLLIPQHVAFVALSTHQLPGTEEHAGLGYTTQTTQLSTSPHQKQMSAEALHVKDPNTLPEEDSPPTAPSVGGTLTTTPLSTQVIPTLPFTQLSSTPAFTTLSTTPVITPLSATTPLAESSTPPLPREPPRTPTLRHPLYPRPLAEEPATHSLTISTHVELPSTKSKFLTESTTLPRVETTTQIVIPPDKLRSTIGTDDIITLSSVPQKESSTMLPIMPVASLLTELPDAQSQTEGLVTPITSWQTLAPVTQSQADGPAAPVTPPVTVTTTDPSLHTQLPITLSTTASIPSNIQTSPVPVLKTSSVPSTPSYTESTTATDTPLHIQTTFTPIHTSTSVSQEDSPTEPTPTVNAIHAEELLEKYGYLNCIPPGSERNTHLHRLLLYRRENPEPNTSHQYTPLDFRLFSLVNPRLPTDMKQYYRKKINDYVLSSTEDVEGKTPLIRLKIIEPTLKSYWYSRRKGMEQLLTGRGRGARRAVVVEDPAKLGYQYLPVCSKVQIQEAIDKFQAAYHVGVGGTLDLPTLELLSRPRCGNPDNLMEEDSDDVEPSAVWPPNIVSFLHRRRRSLVVPERGKTDGGTKDQTKPLESTSDDRQSEASMVGTSLGGTANRYDPSTEPVPDQERLHRVALALREATRAKHPSVIQHEEWEPHPQEAPMRRRRWVQDLVDRIHSGEEDARLAALTPHILARTSKTPDEEPQHGRRKRSAFTHLGQQFMESLITWRLVTSGYSSQLAVSVQRAALALAFRMWSEVIPKIFIEDNSSNNPNDANINIGFGRRSHLGCVTEFDGLGGELSHALRDARDAQIHMDDDEHFTLDSDHGTNLLKVAVHEIGHVLGLDHVLRNYSIMYAVYEKVLPNQGLELGWEDRKLVQRIYGRCVGKFSTVFDFLRWRSDGSLSYNTYFFRGDHFWMYENKYNRTRFGDPLYIDTEWRGLPDDIDAYTHIFTSTRDSHLFFKGEHYYMIDPETRNVLPGFPRRIAHDFHGPRTAKKPYPKAIPSNLDAVYFDIRDENLYFFKGRKVYGYDIRNGTEGCCLPGYPRLIHNEFTRADEGSRNLPKKLDAVYYSYTDQTLYFFKERLFWELVTFHPRDTKRTNEVLGPFFVHDKWYDICDTDIDGYNAYRVNRKK
ncbi:uncharacterized protein LOC134779485 [Penaeus indicus]|uniref:uncharacterized protein LOC134779485 n=1 Tax=Penaeus indicus TaxID=29960 RepID=UPI00300C6DE8